MCYIHVLTEVSVAHQLCWNLILHRLGLRQLETFVGSEEEGFVAPIVKTWDHNRPSGTHTEIVCDLGRLTI